MLAKEDLPPLKIPEVSVLELNPSYGKFVAQPVEPGFDTTIGNALRRVLLRAIPGAAVTWLKIEGISHEFSTIPYMKEDVLEFMLNVKMLAIRPITGLKGKLYLRVNNREGEITAGDIQPSADFEIANPELVLATLDSPKASLWVEFNVEVGRGYLPSEKQNKDELPADALLLDSIFSPIKMVNFYTEPLLIADKEYKKLFLEVWTNKAISPQEAVSQAVNILMEQLSSFARITEAKPEPIKTFLDRPIEEVSNFSTRIKNALKRGGIDTLGELLEWTEEELRNIPSLGERDVKELIESLKEMGLSLKQE